MQQNRFPQMTRLARGFPVFAEHMGQKHDAPGVEPWDAEKLAACAGAWSSGEQHVVRFLLTVFAGEVDIDCYKIGRFDFMSALAMWDTQSRNAFIWWAKQPFFP